MYCAGRRVCSSAIVSGASLKLESKLCEEEEGTKQEGDMERQPRFRLTELIYSGTCIRPEAGTI